MATDPFIAATQRIAANHYGGRPPMAWLQRLSPQLRATPEGRRLLGALSVGQTSLVGPRVKRTPYGSSY